MDPEIWLSRKDRAISPSKIIAIGLPGIREQCRIAQWYTGGERSGQAFALANLGELLFFAFFVEAPMVVADDATRAMLCERGYNAIYAAS